VATLQGGARPSGEPASRRPVTLAATALFLLLVAASVGAFFLTTRLKRSTPVVQGLSFNRYVSPNGDGRLDRVRISFRTKRRDEVTVAIVNDDGDEVRVLARDRELTAGPHSFRWNGRVSGGVPAADGQYRVEVGLRRQGRSIISPRKLFVDTSPPTPVVRYVSPDSISPDGAGGSNSAGLLFDGPVREPPRLLVYRTDRPGRQVVVARRTGSRNSHRLSWDGLVGSSGSERPAPPGNYMMVVRVQDAAGNVGPAGLPPARGSLRGHPGVVVSYVSALGPLGPVRAGALARFSVRTDGRRYRWRLRRLGSGRTLERGASRATTLRVRAPHGRSGVFLLALQVGAHRYETPFSVQAEKRRPVLVVLPAVAWQARNDLDTNGDGFGDVLPEDDEVALHRPFAGNGLPEGFTAREAPALLFLDRERLRYDVTTDLALADPSARPPVRYSGILFAGPPRFYSRSMAGLVRSYVEAGGRVAWLGTGGFTRSVAARKGVLASVRGSDRSNLFGERFHAGRPSGSLTVLGDTIGFFAGVAGPIGPFPALEEGQRLPAGDRLLASAGREGQRPSLAVYRHRKGVVVRVGADGFSVAANESPDAGRIMRMLWTLLAH
jgi:N,N-dimethylformamidase beta subunit-like, C-terminal/FlgD Ig-like domain